jgi:hypothetical protein
MTKRTRYFMAGSAAVVVAGLTVGSAAYLSGGFPSVSAAPGREELAFVPSDAAVVAYAHVRGIMDSELRQRLKRAMPFHEQGQQEFQEHTGIDIERDIDYVVAAMTPGTAGKSGFVVARGRFDDVRLEGLAREHGAQLQDYRGKRLLVLDVASHDQAHTGVLAFLEPGLVAIGDLGAVQRAIDARMNAQSITTNNEIMDLVNDIEGSNNAWAVGRLDVLTSQAILPEQVARQIPAVKTFAAAGHINGGLAGMFRAEARDEQSAENLRDVVRGFMALARMQGQSDPKIAALTQSLELTGTGKTVSLSFTLPAELLELMALRVPVQAH